MRQVLLAHASQCCSSLHTSYFIRDVLHDFCGFILDVYKNNRRLLEEYIEETGCHISDMSLAKLYFSKVRTSNIMNLQDPVQERDEPLPALFDVTIRSVEDFASCCHYKIQVKANAWENNAHFSQGGGRYPIIMTKLQAKKLSLRSLHFQGDSKKLMPLYMSRPLRGYLYFYYAKWQEFFRRARQSVGILLRGD